MLWGIIGTLMAITGVYAVRFGGDAFYLVMTGWIIGPFFLWWLGKNVKYRFGNKD